MNSFFSTLGEIIKYGGTTFAALVATSIYTTTDGIFVGNWIGTDALEAMALVFPVTTAFAAIGMLFEIGGSAIVSEKIGSNKNSLAEKIMRLNYAVAFIFCVIIAIAGNIYIEPLLKMLSDTSEGQHIIEMAVSFLRITFCGLPFLLVIILTGAFMRCIEKPTHVFYLFGTVSLTNIILDALFIIVFGWGMEGAAFATLISQILGTVISLWYFKYSSQKFKTSLSFATFEYIGQEFKIGGGFAVTNLMMCFIGYFLNATLMSYDATHLLAAVTISNIILSFIDLPLDGLDTGIQPLICRLFAAKKKTQYLSVMRCGFLLIMILVFAMYAVLMIFTEEVANFFSDEPVTAEMVTFLRFTFLFEPLAGFQIWLSGIMAALEDEWRNLLISFLPLVVQVPLIMLLPKFFAIEFIALNYSILDVIAAAAAFVLIRPFLKSHDFSLKEIFTR